MKVKIVFILAAIVLLHGIVQAKEWYSGGNLQRSKVSEFVAASPDNQLATCANWTARATDVAFLKQNGINSIRDGAEAVRQCIVKSAEDGAASNQDTVDLAIMCMTLLKHQYPWMLTGK